MKYKVGDIVKLRDDLEGGVEIGDYYYSHKMSDFKGEKVTIVEVDEKEKNYSIEEDCRLHYWTDEMIEPTDNTKIEELDVNALTWNDLLDYQKLEILFDKLNEVINKVNNQTTVLLAQDKYIKEIQDQLDY